MFGLLLMGALDSSFLTLPFGNDFLLIGLVSSSRGATWILYVLAAAIGSVIGVLIIDVVMRKAGERGLHKFVSHKTETKLKKKLDKGTGWFAFTTAVLPPPFPFTPAIMSASALQASPGKIVLGVLLGRLVRFTIEALLAIYLGRRVITSLLKSPALDYFVYGLIGVAAVATGVTALKWVRRNRRAGASVSS